MNLLILASLRKCCGNYSTADRIRSHFEQSDVTCFMQDADSFQNDSDFADFVTKNRINAIFVLHAYRGGKWLCNLGSRLAPSIPYGVIYGGTDVNGTNADGNALQVMFKVISGASFLVVFSDAMKAKAMDVWDKCMTLNGHAPPLREEMFRRIPQAPVTNPAEDDIASQVRREYCLPDDSVFFTLVTGIRPVKDPLYLVKTFSEWHKTRRKDASLVIVGPVLDETYAGRFVCDVETAPGVLYVGSRSHEVTLALVRDSRALVNCSLSEGMSVAILEAMQMGVPVIARRIAGNTAVITDGQNGMLFTHPQEFITKAEELLASCEVHKRLSQNGQRYIEEYHNIKEERQAYISLAHELSMLRPPST